MKNYELLPTKENLITTLKENLLNRNQDIKTFIDLLMCQECGVSIALDGNWGSGKTFFVKQTILGLNAINPMTQLDPDDKKTICTALGINPLESEENYDLTVYYDAWKNDSDTDPVFSIIYEIAKQIGDFSFFDKDIHLFKTAASIFNLVKSISIGPIGISTTAVSNIIDNFTEENLQSKFKAGKELQDTIKQFFTEARIEQGNRIIIFIDELDRCTPYFAVRLLEQIKHYFSDENIIFVFSLNIEQLQHTIKNYYGYDFNATKYLDRFFNYNFRLQRANPEQLYYKLGINNDMFFSEICKRITEIFHFELRESIHFYRQAEITIHRRMASVSPGFPSQNGQAFIICYIVPLLIGLKMSDITMYQSFINGDNPKPLLELFETEKVNDYLLKLGLTQNESFAKDIFDDDTIIEIPKEALVTKIYDAIFNPNQRESKIGSLEFNSTSRNYAEKYASVLSPAANYINSPKKQ